MKKCLLSLLLSSITAFAAAPIKDLKVTGTSQISGGTFTIQTGVTFTAAAGSTVDLSAGTLTLATGQVAWAKVSKTSSSLADLATRMASDLTFTSNVRITLAPGATNAGLNVGSYAGNPSAPSNGDLWYNSTANALNARINGATVALGAGGGSGSFIGLTDVPANFTGAGLKTVRVNTGASALEFYTLTGADITFTDDVRITFNPGSTNAGLNVGAQAGNPSAPTNGDLWYDSTATALKARINGATVSLGSGGGGSSTFIGLTDVPANFTGAGSKFVAVNSGATALEFVTSAGGTTWVTAPTSSISTGTAGQQAYDASFYYVCVATNTWRAVRLTPAFGNPYVSIYSSDGDTNGVFYFLGTSNGSPTIPWANPHTAGIVTVVMSSIGNGTATDIVNRATSDSYTANVANSWIAVDLGSGRTLIPTKYSLRSRSSTAGGSIQPRNWKLQGSNNPASNSTTDLAAATWTDLDTQTANASQTTINQWLSLTVSGVSTGYRWLRIYETGANALGSNYLEFGELELYGSLAY